MSASMSRATGNTASRMASAPAFASSMGSGARASAATARPKSAYGHNRSKSHHQSSRPATAMAKRNQYDDDEEADPKGSQPFLISTNPLETLKVVKKAPSALRTRTHSFDVVPHRAPHASHLRAISSPSMFRPITPVMEEPADSDCEQVCAKLEALALGVSNAEPRDSEFGRGMISGREADPSSKHKRSHSRLPQATPSRQAVNHTPTRPPPSSTPKAKRINFINRFTNDRCPVFYDERIEAIEDQFREFTAKMERDVQQAADNKIAAQQLQGRGTSRSARDFISLVQIPTLPTLRANIVVPQLLNSKPFASSSKQRTEV